MRHLQLFHEKIIKKNKQYLLLKQNPAHDLLDGSSSTLWQRHRFFLQR